MRDAEGNIERYPFASYRVSILNQANEEALLDQNHLTRDRKTFTKQMLRSFIKNTVTREPWNGAPWLVKPEIAEQYHIDTNVPPHLQYGNKVAEKKAMRKGGQEGFFGFFASQHLPELKPAVKGQKAKYSAQELAKAKEDQYLEYQRSLTGNPSFGLSRNGASAKHPASRPYNGPTVVVRKVSPKPPPPPPIKYPIEDLDIEPARDGSHRPPLNFLTNTKSSESNEDDNPKDEGQEIKPESVGLLLETWNTLNVYCEVYQLDSFTFDDFLEAMSFHSVDLNCELFVEMHCGVLKKLVNAHHDQDGAIQVPLPDLPEEDSESESEDESNVPTPEPEPTRRTTRSSLAKAEAENLKEQETRSRSNTVDKKTHRAAEMFGDYGWIDRLRKRDFKNGGWELVMVGLLHRLSHRPRLQSACDRILSHLAPLEAEPTKDTAEAQYSTMDINLRIEALQIICMLSLETKAIKSYLEECSNQMTEFRKEKIEHQRARKAA